MTMRNVIMLFVATIMAISSPYATEASGQKEIGKGALEIGRYQLFQGTYTTLDLKYRQASSTFNAVFLLDTATGQVRRYVNRIDEDGRYVETWLTTDIIQQMDSKKTGTPQIEGK